MPVIDSRDIQFKVLASSNGRPSKIFVMIIDVLDIWISDTVIVIIENTSVTVSLFEHVLSICDLL